MSRLLYILFLLFSSLFFGQSTNHFKIPDSLKKKNFEELSKSYDHFFQIDNEKAELYANSILLKAKREKNDIYIYDGYYKIAHAKAQKPSEGQPFADSLIAITGKISTYEYPAKAYIIKGILTYKDFNYKNALDYYLKAQQYAKDKNTDQYFYIKKLVGILKTATEEYPDALSLFLEYYQYEKKNLSTKNKDVKSYIGSIFSVSNAYSKNKNYFKSKEFNKLGFTECSRYKDFSHYAYFLMSEGIADYYLNNYSESKKNLLTVEKKLLKNEDKPNLSVTYYFLGKISLAAHDKNKAINYFKKYDSVSLLANDFLPVTRDGYEVLIDYYKSIDDKENQLKYINKLFYADSIINNNKQYLSKEIYKKYDTPILMQEKEKLIVELNDKNSILYWSFIFAVIAAGILLYFYLKNRKKIGHYKEQAQILLKNISDSEKNANESVILPKPDSSIPAEKVKTSLSDEKRLDIKNKLENFEKKLDFLKKNITIETLAKDLQTNRDYLSKSVNELKGKNFSQYLNSLRISYIVEELKTNEKLRKYTMIAIAEEIGFNTSESFSNAFKKATGTLPSYYIKLLNDKEKKS